MALRIYSLFSGAERSYQDKNENLVNDMKNTTTSKFARPLSAVADAFEELYAAVKAKGSDLDLKTFCDACSLVSILFGSLGKPFKFAELEYSTKVRALAEASETFGTLNNVIEFDVQNDTVGQLRSRSRHLRRVRQGLDLIKTLFQNFLSSHDSSLKDAASTAYAKTCAPYHTWGIRAAVAAGMYALPTREQLLLKLNENEESAKREMRRFINASSPIIEYIDKLYTSRNINLDW
ncbi:hypothetical protein ACS0TY_034009 [Phlomoides rotata]